jgi:hypothetical protein
VFIAIDIVKALQFVCGDYGGLVFIDVLVVTHGWKLLGL